MNMDSIEADCSNDDARNLPESDAAEQGRVDFSESSECPKESPAASDGGDVAEQPAVEMKEVDEAMGDAPETEREVPVDNVATAASSPESATHSIVTPPASPRGFVVPRRQAPPPYDLLALVASAVDRGNFHELLDRLEEIELESNNGIPTREVFACMVATNLIVDDVVNAKMVWKRIPSELKSDSAEFDKLWNIGKKCWSHDYSGLFTELDKNQEWNPYLKPLMTSLAIAARDRVLSLVEKSYKSVRLTSLSTLLGMTNHDSAMALASERNWPVEQGFTFPLKSTTSTTSRSRVDAADDALATLTEYVSFLEE